MMQSVSTTEVPKRAKGLASHFEIVPARREDMKMIAGFVRSSAEWYRPIVDEKDMGEHAVDEAWERTNFERRDFYLGVADGEPIGTISMQHFGDYVYLGYIYLDVRHVGKRYGHRLMRFASNLARARGMKALVLIGHPEATWAKRAYLKFGFDIVASDKRDVLAWQGGVLEPYYEESFELYVCELDKLEVACG